MQRPTGITILAIVYFLSGAFDLLMSCFAMAAGDRLLEDTEASVDVQPALVPYRPLRGSLVFWIALCGTGASLFKLSAGAGLWSLQPWGWRLALLRATPSRQTFSCGACGLIFASETSATTVYSLKVLVPM